MTNLSSTTLISRASLLAFVTFALAGCTDRLATATTTSDDYQVRHPIVVTEKPVTLSLLTGAQLGASARRRIAQFGAEARDQGAGRIEILVPVGAPNEMQTRAALPAIKTALMEGGAISAISVGSYPPANVGGFSPLRISYRAIRAGVAHRCGEWPADLASASSLDSWDNRPYWNYGCAYQNMIATQLDDPRDLEASRGSTPADVRMRMRAIEKVRQGGDPATSWSTPAVGIGSVGGK